MVAQVRVEGVRELSRDLRRLGNKDLQRAVRKAHKSTADVVAARARERAPRRTGRLAGSIKPVGSMTAAIVKADGKVAPYDAAIHWGRKRGNVGFPPGNHPGRNVIKARPFLWDAAHEVQDQALHVYEHEIGHVIARAAASVRGV